MRRRRLPYAREEHFSERTETGEQRLLGAGESKYFLPHLLFHCRQASHRRTMPSCLGASSCASELAMNAGADAKPRLGGGFGRRHHGVSRIRDCDHALGCWTVFFPPHPDRCRGCIWGAHCWCARVGAWVQTGCTWPLPCASGCILGAKRVQIGCTPCSELFPPSPLHIGSGNGQSATIHEPKPRRRYCRVSVVLPS